MLDFSVLKIMQDLKSTRSKITKEIILTKNETNENFKKVMQFVFSPYVTTGIGKKKLDSCTSYDAHNIEDISWDEIVARFTGCTGTDVDVKDAILYINTVLMIKETYADYMRDIITKTLTIGITATTLNKIYGNDFIPKGGCMLGTLQKDVAAKYNNGYFIVTEKLDGQRKCNVVQAEESNAIYSGRNWLPDRDYPEINKDSRLLPAGYVYDGEMLATGTFNNSIERRQATASICSKKGPKVGVEHHIFDIIPVDEFKTGICHTPSIIRKYWVAVLFNDIESQTILWQVAALLNIELTAPIEFKQRIISHNIVCTKPVPVLGYIVNKITEKSILDFVAPIWKRGDEGIMLNEATAPYEIKRSRGLLKVKNTEEYELKIIDWAYGTVDTANALVCGSITVLYKGFKVKVGSGFSFEQREDIAYNPDNWIGKICTVQCFGESHNQEGGTSLNSPVFICIRDDKDEADF